MIRTRGKRLIRCLPATIPELMDLQSGYQEEEKLDNSYDIRMLPVWVAYIVRITYSYGINSCACKLNYIKRNREGSICHYFDGPQDLISRHSSWASTISAPVGFSDSEAFRSTSIFDAS